MKLVLFADLHYYGGDRETAIFGKSKKLTQYAPSMLNQLIEAPLLPKTATTALTKNAEHTVFHVKTTYPEHKMSRGIIEEHNWAKSVPVSIRGDFQEVYLLPELKKLESRREKGRICFETGDIFGYKAFLLK